MHGLPISVADRPYQYATSLSIRFNIDPELSAGTYSGTITVSATINSQAVTQSATVTLAISTPSPMVTATPASLSFSYTTGGPIPAPSLASAFLLSSSGSPLTATLSCQQIIGQPCAVGGTCC